MLQDRHGAGYSDKIIKESRLDSTLFFAEYVRQAIQ